VVEKNTWIIGGSAVASVVAVAGLVYHLFTRNTVITTPDKPAAALSGGTKPEAASKSDNTKKAADAESPGADKSTSGQSQSSSRTSGTAASKSAAAKPGTAASDAGRSAASKTAAAGSGTQPDAASANQNTAAAKPADRRIPSFDIVRVEPTGDSVIAGRSEPGADIELLNKGKTFAKAKADANGQFVIIPQNLKPGAHQLQLRSRLNDQTRDSEQAVAVSVPEQGKKDVIVALAAPGKATVILSDPKPQAAADASAKARSQAAAASPPAAGSAATTSPSPASGSTPPAGKVASGNTAAGQAASGDASNTVVAAADPSKAGPDASATPVAPQVPVRIRIVEAEQQGGFFVSGFAASGSRIRLYLNRSFIAEAQTGKDGSWSMRVSRGMSPGDYTVRADIVEPVTGKVLSRAEVPFDYPAARVAAAQPSGPAGKQPPAQANGSATSTATAARAASGTNVPGNAAADTAPSSTPGQVAAQAGERGKASTAAAGKSANATAGKSAATQIAAAQSSGNTPSAVAEQGNGASPSTAVKREAAAGTSAQTTALPGKTGSGASNPNSATAAASPSATPSQATGDNVRILPPPAPAAHVVIERLTTASVNKGDSLWRISRNILGRGIRYTQIYAANTSQIRNPHLIYPGQVLVVPLGNPQNGSGKPAAPAPQSAPAPKQ
jgi:nucleoid-associated protein YgaU